MKKIEFNFYTHIAKQYQPNTINISSTSNVFKSISQDLDACTPESNTIASSRDLKNHDTQYSNNSNSYNEDYLSTNYKEELEPIYIDCKFITIIILLCLFFSLNFAIGIGSKMFYDLWNSYNKDEINQLCQDKYSRFNQTKYDYTRDLFTLFLSCIVMCFNHLFILLLFILRYLLIHLNNDLLKYSYGWILLSSLASFICNGYICLNFLVHYYIDINEYCDKNSKFYKDFTNISNWFQPLAIFILVICAISIIFLLCKKQTR